MNPLHWILFWVNLAAFVVLAVINPLFESLNLAVRAWVNRTRRPALRPVMIVTHVVHDVLALAAQLLILGLVMGTVFHDWYRATVLTGSIFFQTVVIGAGKRLTAVDRPPQTAAHVFMTSGSYPSGHSSVSLSFALLVPAVLRPFLPEPVYWVVLAALLGVALLTAYGRLYLDVHWLSDVFGGWFLAVATYLAARMLL